MTASSLVFATGPLALDEEGDELRERFGERLTAALGRPVQVLAARSYAEVRKLVASGEAQLAWLPPAVFVELEREAGAHLLAAVERSHGAGYRGVLFVRRDSKARAPADLAHARVAWVDPSSSAGYLFPRAALRALGLATLFAEERFLGSHGSVVHAVMRGDADAGATFAQTGSSAPGAPAGAIPELAIAGWYPYAGADGMRPVLVSDPIPSDVICAGRRGLGADELHDVREALLTLHEAGAGELIDELLGGPRLIAAHPADYDVVRAALA